MSVTAVINTNESGINILESNSNNQIDGDEEMPNVVTNQNTWATVVRNKKNCPVTKKTIAPKTNDKITPIVIIKIDGITISCIT